MSDFPYPDFPFQRGDRIQHCGGSGPVSIVRGVDQEAGEAWAEPESGVGHGFRVLNPSNWKRVATDPRDR